MNRHKCVNTIAVKALGIALVLGDILVVEKYDR